MYNWGQAPFVLFSKSAQKGSDPNCIILVFKHAVRAVDGQVSVVRGFDAADYLGIYSE